MKNLLYKELVLGIPKPMYLFALLTVLLLIPNYPYIVAMGYVAMALFTALNIAATNRDCEFTASLPVKRSDIVLSKMFVAFIFEAVTLLAAIPFALIGSLLLNRGGNMVGLDANITFFGCTLIEYAVLNAVFFPLYFRTGYKAGIPALLGVIVYAVVGTALELIIQFVPALRILDSLSAETFGYQAIVLGVGALIYIVSAFYTHKLSVKIFEKVNL